MSDETAAAAEAPIVVTREMIQAVIAKLKQDRAIILPVLLEGGSDFDALDLEPGSKEFIEADQAKLQELDGNLLSSATNLEILLQNNPVYPEIPPVPASDQVLADLDEQIDSLTRRRQRYTTRDAVTGAINLGAPRPVPQQP